MKKTDKKLLMIDQDDCFSRGGLLYVINEFLSLNNLKHDYKEEDFKNYYMQDVIPDGLKDDFFDYVSYANIYSHTYMLPNAKEVIEELNEVYRVILVTDYIIPEIKRKCGENLKNKFNFLCRELPSIDPSHFVFTAVKDIVNPDIAIDDKISHLCNAKTKLLFSAYHNMDISESELKRENVERMDNWLEVRKRLLK